MVLNRSQIGLLLFACALTAVAAEQGPVVDSGSFGIVVRGQRVATETFKMEQAKGVNVASAQLQMLDGTKATQLAQMELLPTGALRKYTWRETNPGKAQVIVEPQDETFLVVHSFDTEGAAAKDATQPLSPLTAILDDNFFSQLQLLAWRYLATGCTAQSDGSSKCELREQKFPVFNPRQQLAQTVTMSFLGTQKLKFKSGEKTCKIIKIAAEAGDWMMWMDEQNRLEKIVAENVEVLRD
jgi:hypothetical protein